MRSILFAPDAKRSAALAAPLRDEGYAPEVRIVEAGVADAADIAATRGAVIVFIDLAIGALASAAVCSSIRDLAGAVPPLLAILGEPPAHVVDGLLASGVNMYFPDDPAKLALRIRFLRGAVERRADLANTIAALRASEARNRRIEAEHRALLERAPDAVFVSRDGRIMWVNQHAVELLGFSTASEIVGQLTVDLVPDSGRAVAEQRIRERATGKDEAPFEQTLIRRDGTEAPVWIAGVPIIFDGEPARVAFVRDLTEQRQLEMQLMATDRLASLGRLAASVGHEINNPLTYVLGNLELATRKLANAAAKSDVLGLLEDALVGAEQVQRIVEDLRVFSQRKVDAPAPVDLRAVVESCLRMTAGEIRHRAKCVIAISDVPPALASQARVAQVITNILLNAAQALPEGDAEANTISIAARLDGDRIELRITDTGEGITPEHLPHVFEPFFTTKTDRGGSGLGLSICRMLVASQGGELTIASERGKGTCVTVRLPVATSRTTAPTAGVARNVTPRRVLLVDDEPRVAKLLRDGLAPHDVTTAGGGREALRLLESGERFDVIVCDLMMPDLGGADVYDGVRARYPGLERRMVFITGGAFTPRSASFLAGVTNICLEKPFTIEGLFEAIEQVAKL